MKRGLPAQGYTILEVMIFLAVTGVLFLSAVYLVQGQIAKAQFSTAVNDLDSDIRTVINDINTGFYPHVDGFNCTVNSAGPRFPAGTNEQGTNTACTFIGKVVQFGVGKARCTGTDTRECVDYNIYTMAGRRVTSTGGAIDSLLAAQPRVLTAVTARKTTGHGLRVTKMLSGGVDIGSVGFFMNQGSAGTSNPVSGAHTADVVAIPNSSIGQQPTTTGAIGTIDGLKLLSPSTVEPFINPPDGVIMCLIGGNNQRASITIGSSNRQLSTQVTIGTTVGCP